MSALHDRIRRDVEKRILSGEWRPGHRIPYEHELMADYGCARMTVNRAISALAAEVSSDPQGRQVTIDLPAQTVAGPAGTAFAFEIGEEAKDMLVHGLDAIDLTLKDAAALEAFRAADRTVRPWIYFAADAK